MGLRGAEGARAVAPARLRKRGVKERAAVGGMALTAVGRLLLVAGEDGMARVCV